MLWVWFHSTGTDTGMELRLAVVVESVSEGGVAFASGVKPGDEIWRVRDGCGVGEDVGMCGRVDVG